MSRLRERAAQLLVVAVASVGTGCGLPLSDEETPVANLCDQDSQCGDGICASIEGTSRCVATSADLAGIVFQIEGTSENGTSISHVFGKGLSIQGARDAGVIVSLDLDVPPPLHVRGRFLDPDPIAGCTGADGSVPVKVELRSTAPLSGLEQVFTVESVASAGESGLVHTFDVPVPPGTYDVYIAPLPLECGQPGAVALPPRIFPAIVVESDVALEPEAEAPRRLTGVLVAGTGLGQDAFRIELVEPKRGLRVSESPPVPPPVDGVSPLFGGPSGDDPDGIAYYYTEGLVLRLTDAAGRLTVHWKFDALDFDGDGEVEIDLADLIANPQTFRATVVDVQKRPLPAASVTIKSLSLTGQAGKNSSFRVSAESDAMGVVEVALVPGTYQVLVAPASDDAGPALLEDEWVITEDSLCCGKTFELMARPLLTGAVTTATGEPVAGVPVLASPTLPGTRDYFSRSLESLDLLPRQVAATTDGSGAFDMRVDPGTYDLAIRATKGTGFSWLVLPATVVASIDQQPAAALGSLVLPSPAVIVGRASLADGALAGAVLRAYLPLLDDEGTQPARVVAIGEAITDATGHFELPLPPTIARGSRGSSLEGGAGGGSSTRP